jgi:hypothetical protein
MLSLESLTITRLQSRLVLWQPQPPSKAKPALLQRLRSTSPSSTSAGAPGFARFCFRLDSFALQYPWWTQFIFDMQNLNGPCPLLAIANILLLRNCIEIPESAARISTDDLLALVADYIVASNRCTYGLTPRRRITRLTLQQRIRSVSRRRR